MPGRDRHRDRDVNIEYIQQPPAARPQSKVGCGCNCPTCSGSGHCHNMDSGCNVR
jgi:hypothetical protein